ncbi:hypothetical protein [Desulfurobacterium sp. TC5-1]|uniref:hypothetical protein n=1 Tax=Desulfurobacterium sp. TC5-1 TaxID=1158318 RepID=UPI0003B34340|nr:hypothetical protein [Desulfurobacterium sp. TC5-1]
MKKTLVLLAAVSAVMFSSCVQEVENAVSLYNTAVALNRGYHAYSMVDSMKNAIPVFKDYKCVKVQALIMPGKTEKVKKLRSAFVDDFSYIVREYVKAAHLEDVKVCSTENCTDCKGKMLVIQFLENGYSPNLFNKITMGGLLRGSLRYIDGESGRVIREEKLEDAKNYEDLLQEIAMSVGSKAAQTAITIYPDKDPQKIIDEVNKVNPIKPEYRKLFEESR